MKSHKKSCNEKCCSSAIAAIAETGVEAVEKWAAFREMMVILDPSVEERLIQVQRIMEDQLLLSMLDL